MPIPITCPKCQANGFVPDQALHQSATCPICQTTFTVVESPTPPAGARPRGDWVDPMTVALDLPKPTVPPPPEPAKPLAAIAADNAGIPDWIRTERAQFEGYVSTQLGRLDKLRRENAEAESRHEATCIQRSMELSRLAANLEHRQKEQDVREAEFQKQNEAAKALAETTAQLSAGLAERETAVAELESRTAELRTEAASLSSLVSELRPVVEQLELRKTEAQTIQAELKAKQVSLDRRLIEVGRNELSIQKRMVEIQELERALQDELETREADLEHQRAMLLEEVRSLRSRLPVDTTTPPPKSKPLKSIETVKVIEETEETETVPT